MAEARDFFERYYAEKLWESIPAVYRHEDGIAEEPGVLRALVQVLAKQAATLRRSQDRLWEDQFIETCDEWAVPYIGDLVATRLLSALNQRGRRIDVAKTIYYRRRKGTPRVLEELISDISGWEGKLVEQFQKLGRSRHGLDPFPETLNGRYSGTSPGGWADLRNPRISELADGPFEEYFHTPDVRRHRGLDGRYAIPKLAFYLYRLRAFGAVAVTPFKLDDRTFTFDPSGRDIPLFSQRLRSGDWDAWHSAFEWELPAPIPCRLLGHAEYRLDETIIRRLVSDQGLSATAADDLRTIANLRFKSETSLVNVIGTLAGRAEIQSPAIFLPLLALSLVPDCGKQALLPDAGTLAVSPLESSSVVVELTAPANRIVSVENTTAAHLGSGSPLTGKELAIDAEMGRFRFATPPDPAQGVSVSYHYGFSGPTGAGTYDRITAGATPDRELSGGGPITGADLVADGLVRIKDSKTYSSVADQTGIVDETIEAANGQRPYVQLQGDWALRSGSNNNAMLLLDGLWIGAAANVDAALVIGGNFECVVIRNCTLDPGGTTAVGDPIVPLRLVIAGFVENLCVENSILGPVRLDGPGTVEAVSFTDCIIQTGSGLALDLPEGRTALNRTTVFGPVKIHRLEASEVIITGTATVTDTQAGCFRFSAAPGASRLPRPYESFLFAGLAEDWFTSRRFGHPGYAQLSETAPPALARGAENGSEMGAFSRLLNPIKMDGLHTKIEEYMPFGLIPIFINKT
ncbi:MAG: hypothetical protein ICV83_08185 [Cytophagales bacterium]|nr:hypothetical protein [Cytophagales bacterium]